MSLLLFVPGCLLAAWWQVHVALAGDSLGWVYSIEWPVFAGFGIYLWWFLIHDDPESAQSRHFLRRERSEAAAERLEPAQQRVPEREDEELRAYNDYLASLRAKDDGKSFRLHRGGARSR